MVSKRPHHKSAILMTTDSQPLYPSPGPPTVTYVAGNLSLLNKAEILADTLDLQLLTPAVLQEDIPLLVYTEKGLHFQLGKNQGILYIDFLSGAQNYRRLHGGGIKQSLARAVGIKPGKRPTVLDVTAGLGKDAFLLATLGCKVRMVERSPILNALLKDALERAASDPLTGEIIENRLTLLEGDSRTIFAELHEKMDTIYMDPMYPHRNKSALNRLEMRIIRSLVGDDRDAVELLHIALQQAKKRVVVKRPKGAPLINSLQPSHVISMKNSRYDVYMI